jgi:hypothetical protein
VDAGVDDQARGAEGFGLQAADVAVDVAVVPAEVARQPLGVEPPASMKR